MRKFPAILALAMALVMLLLPMSAMAEPTTATVIQIANPTLSVDSDSRSMPGLALQLALCENADASLTQIIADIIVNNQNANSAMLQFDSLGNIVGLIGGMSSAYTVNMQEAYAMGMTGYGEAARQLEQLFNALETWTLPDTITSIISSHFSTFTLTDMGISTNANGVEMQYVNIQGDITGMIIDIMNAIENDSLVMSFIQMLDPTMTSLDLVESSGIGNGNGFRIDATIGSDAYGTLIDCDADLIVYSDNVDSVIIRIAADIDTVDPVNSTCDCSLSLVEMDGAESNIFSVTAATSASGWTFSGTANADGAPMTIDGAYTTADTLDTLVINFVADAENKLAINYTNNKTGDMSGAIAADMSVTEYGETATVGFSAEYALTDTGISANGKLTVTDPYSGESAIVLNDLTVDSATGKLNLDIGVIDPYSGNSSFVLTGSYAATDTGMNITGDLRMTDSYGSLVALKLNELSFNSLTGNFAASVTYEDDFTTPVTLALTLTSVEPAAGAVYSGLLAFTGNDGYSTIGATADVHVLTADVDTANFYIDPAAAINLISITDEQMFAAETELNTILENLAASIMNAYPDIFN